jgi:hypothetical protein
VRFAIKLDESLVCRQDFPGDTIVGSLWCQRPEVGSEDHERSFHCLRQHGNLCKARRKCLTIALDAHCPLFVLEPLGDIPPDIDVYALHQLATHK